MDPLIQDFEFLDLTDINDAELEHLHNVLYATEPNPNAKYPELPWTEPVYDEALVMNGEPDDSIPDDTPPLNADVPAFPPSSAHLPVTMYQMMPPVYVNNVTANVSVHPYMGYHHAMYQPQESQSTRGRRPKNNNKARDYRNNDPNLESPNTGGQIPQAYPAASFIPMHHHPYNHHYYATPPPPSAQHATGTPLYTMPMPSHVPMYPQPPLYPYHPAAMYSSIEHAPYTEVPIKENMPVSQYPPPEKLHTYDYNAQNRIKDNIPPVQYQTDGSNETYSQDSNYNNQNNEINTNDVSKNPVPIVQYQPDVEVTNYNQQSDAVPPQNVMSEGPVVNVSVKSDPPSVKKEVLVPVASLKPETSKAAITYTNGQYSDVGHDSVSPKLTPAFSKNVKVVENPNFKQENKKVDIKPIPEVKMEGTVKFVGDVIVSELKSDAQVFQPASSKNIIVSQTLKDKPSVNIVRSPVTSVKVESVLPTAPLVKEKPTEVHQQPIHAPPEEQRPNQQQFPNTTAPVAREDIKSAVTPIATPVATPVNNAPSVKQSAPEPAAAVTSPALPKGSWASLFQKSSPADQDTNASRLVARVEPFQEARDNPAATARAAAEARRVQLQCQDPHLYRLGEFLCKYELEHKSVSLLPRGLTNRSNWCYINSILQSLLACPPFYNLMKALPVPRKNQKSTTPILDSIVQFVNEFSPLSSVTRSRKERSFRKEDGSMDVQTGPSFEPAYIYKMLNNIRSDTFKVEGRQEDAEEFLSCLLNALNDEMMEVMKLIQDTEADQVPVSNGNETASQDDSDSEWKVMGPKNKGSITRRSDFGRTPISDIFRGHLRSRVLRAGDQFTDNVQPFFTLQLDIEKSQSVKEALDLLVGKDPLEGVTCSKTNQEVEAWQQVTLEDLPMVLVLHLKWFDYKMDGCSKIMKTVEFPIELKVDSKLMSATKKYTLKQKQYKLFAVVYHDGKEATKGHYVTDVFHVGYGGWIRYDDSSVRTVQENLVLHPRIPRVPYLLYYRRCDTIGNQTPVR